MSTFRRKRFSRHQRSPSFNPLTMNMEIARALADGDKEKPVRTLHEPGHDGVGTQFVKDEDASRSRGKPPGPMH